MKRFWLIVNVAALSIFTVPVAVVGTVVSSLIFLPLPVTLPKLRTDVPASQISRVYDIEGNEIAVLKKFDQNIPVKAADLPITLKQAVISSEDRNFYKHAGVDARGSLRALLADLRGGRVVQGGSTITQQYVRNAYKFAGQNIGNQRNLVRKVKEAIVASEVDRKLSKDEILFSYLNSIFLGDGAYGVGAASEVYFHKRVNDLTLSESALLAGIIPAPAVYEPRGDPGGADLRRRQVLRKMLEQHYITPAQHDEAAAQTVWPVGRGKPPGPVTLIQAPVQGFRNYPYFIDYVEKYLIANGLDPDINGYRIDTSLDPAVQKDAEASVTASLKGIAAPIDMALVAVEPPTGFVKALVGGRDFQASAVNLALGKCPTLPTAADGEVKVRAACWDDPKTNIGGGGTGRQTGSSWKPFTLTAAFEKGISPSKVYPAPGVYHIPNCKPTKDQPCTIHNAEGGGGGSQSLRTATAASTNTVFAGLEADIGPAASIEVAKKLGVASAFYEPRKHGFAGLTLGELATAPIEMASAYAVFANRGMRQETTPIVKVTELSTGKVKIDNTRRQAKRVISEVVADNVTDLLRGVITSGTARGNDIGRPAAGKTGTTEAFADAWFVGYTPTLSTAVWMGNRDGEATITIPHRGHIFGATISAPTWKSFMTAALKDVPVTDFNQPAPIKSITDELDLQARHGFNPGAHRYPADTGDGGTYQYDLPPPVATEPTTSTTSTTAPPGGGGGIIFP